jgi:vacuolar-type H+-ATPase subunit E/Vma4
MTDHLDPTLNVKNIVSEAVKRIDDLRTIEVKRIDEKFKEIDLRYEAQFTAAKEAVASALEGTKEAINKADITTDKRFDLLSEKIDGIAEAMSRNSVTEKIYVTHTDLSIEMEKLRNSFEGMLRPVITYMNSQTGKDKGVGMGWAYIVGGIAAASGTIALVLNAIRLFTIGS